MTKKKLQEKIDTLEAQLKEARTHTYIGETHTLHCSDGELYIGYNNWGHDSTLVFEVNQLYKDLPFIISQVCKEQKKMQKMHLKLIKETLTEI